MATKNVIDLEIFTDGSCKKLTTRDSLGFIAYGFIALEDSKVVQMGLSSSETPSSTSQRAELLAIIDAIKFAEGYKKEGQAVKIFSDSAYAINGLNSWIYNWRANGWKSAKGEEVSNLDLWTILNQYADLTCYSFQKVKGHENSLWNNKIDALVQNETKSAKERWRGKNG